MSIHVLLGAEAHTLTHRGRSRVGLGCKTEPLICRKPHFCLLRANTPPPPLLELIHPYVSLTGQHNSYNHHFHHTDFHISSAEWSLGLGVAAQALSWLQFLENRSVHRGQTTQIYTQIVFWSTAIKKEKHISPSHRSHSKYLQTVAPE